MFEEINDSDFIHLELPDKPIPKTSAEKAKESHDTALAEIERLKAEVESLKKAQGENATE